MHGDEPGEAGRQARLDQGDGNGSPTTQSPRKVLAKARPGHGRNRHAVGTGRTPPRLPSPATKFLSAGSEPRSGVQLLTSEREGRNSDGKNLNLTDRKSTRLNSSHLGI